MKVNLFWWFEANTNNLKHKQYIDTTSFLGVQIRQHRNHMSIFSLLKPNVRVVIMFTILVLFYLLFIYQCCSHPSGNPYLRISVAERLGIDILSKPSMFSILVFIFLSPFNFVWLGLVQGGPSTPSIIIFYLISIIYWYILSVFVVRLITKIRGKLASWYK